MKTRLTILLLFISFNIFANSFIVPTGPYKVGFKYLQATDSARARIPHELELVTQNDKCTKQIDNRTLSLGMYYPTDSMSNTKASYLNTLLLSSYGYPEFILDSLGIAKKHSVSNSTILKTSGKFPVVFFTPGYGLGAEFYTSYVEDLASHGYIVAVVGHTYFSGHVFLKNNDCVVNFYQPNAEEIKKKLNITFDDFIAKIVKVGKLDLEFLSNNLSTVLPEFYNHIDTKKIVYMGHSFGGLTTSMMCSGPNSLCKAGINLDGGRLADVEPGRSWAWHMRSDIPFLKIAAIDGLGKDDIIPEERKLLRAELMNIEKMGHDDLTDKRLFRQLSLLPTLNTEVEPMPEGGWLDYYKAYSRLNTKIQSFLNQHL